MDSRVKKKAPNQREKILFELNKAGDQGLTTRQLLNIAHGYRARLSELYSQGLRCDVTPILTECGDETGQYRYVVRELPESKNNPPKAIDIFSDEFNKVGSSLSLEEIMWILEENNLIIGRKAGAYNKK